MTILGGIIYSDGLNSMWSEVFYIAVSNVSIFQIEMKCNVVREEEGERKNKWGGGSNDIR
jgi:hypothetical protein